jgi:acetyl esterase/lipase
MKLIFLLFLFLFASNFFFSQETNNIRYVYPKKISLGVHLLKAGAHIFAPNLNPKRKLAKKKQVNNPASIPRKYYKEFNIDTIQVAGRSVYNWSQKDKAATKTVLFLHGGAYMMNVFRQHWNFIAEIIRRTNCNVIVPDYPLTPAVTYKESFEMVKALYAELIQKIGSENLILMGDSAGGGYSLALCEQNNELKIAQPSQVILIVPWLDVTLSNPDILLTIKKCPTLDLENLVKIGNSWCGNLDPKNYLVSPIYGNLTNLPQISLFVGTHDILIADAQKFKKMLESQNIPLNYYEYPKLFHDWVMLVKLRESKDALSKIAELINKK